MNEPRLNRWLLIIFYLLAFFLLWAWLLPIAELTETGYISLFLIYIFISFLLSLYEIGWHYTVPVKIIYIFWAVHFVYLEKLFFSLETMRILMGDIFSNIAIIGSGNWYDSTNPFRTILFYALLWMTTYLIHYWIETKRSILLFYIMTIVFISFIDTFSTYSAGYSIIGVMIAGLLLLGLLSVARLINERNIKISYKGFARLSIPLVIIILMSFALTLLLPKLEPVWEDPIPYFVSFIEGDDGAGIGSGEGLATSGYSYDDSKLGGPFREDDSLVFKAEVASKQYWKIETKNVYTSKGWDQPAYASNRSLLDDYLVNDIATTVDSDDVKTAKLTMVEKYPFLLYPYGLTRIITTQNASFVYYFDSNQYETKVDYVKEALDSYEMEFLDEKISLKSLRETRMEDLETDPAIFAETLQLPANLPRRIFELAESVTASSESVYDKAKAVERYFGKNGFMYHKTDVAIPEEEEDYVDQFLFETKKGYCDNFSSSMVVMLRTVGIPARWVKGFAPGEQVRNTGSKERVYHITNNEAHSWVEAYMPGIGWMPFEPTIGFSSQTLIDYDLELNKDDPEIREMPEQERQKIDEEKSKKATHANDSINLSKSLKGIAVWIKEQQKWIVFVGVFLLISSFVLYIKRRRWLPKVLVSLYKTNEKDWDYYEKLYKSLLSQLTRYGLARKSGETLSAYAVKVDQHFGGQTMKELTLAYEKGIYGGDQLTQDWQRLQELWEDLMNRTSD